jgi:DNA repair ATPase RecN
MRNSTGQNRRILDAHAHAEQVQKFRKLSASYHEMQQMLDGIRLLTEWREEEEKLIQYVPFLLSHLPF